MKKYYAVKAGRVPGIYLTWDDCKRQVDGFSGAMYKSFPTEEEAEAYVSPNEDEKEELSDHTAEAYVDGSYNVVTGEYSCGVVFFYQGEEIHMAQKGEDLELASMRNVAGEILGSRMAMERAVELGVKVLRIYHDYQGIASWCLGEWKTNKEGTKAYKEYYDSVCNSVDIRFIKVKGHSGDQYNELADKLAKSVIF